MAAAVGRVLRPRQKQQIGDAYVLPLGGGIIPTSWPWNFWQLGYNPLPVAGGAIVHACIIVGFAMCWGENWSWLMTLASVWPWRESRSFSDSAKR